MGAIVFFAFILFVMGGATAYMGDRMGSYIGKKRHSTFGLRPRHTAMLWTVVSGGVIAVGTLLLFIALNDTFKTALVRGPQLLTANSDLADQNRTLTRTNTSAARLVATDEAAARMAQAKAVDAQKALETASGQLGETKSVLAQSRSVLVQRQAALAAAQQQLAKARLSLSATHTELADAQAQVREARADVQEAKRQAMAADSQIVQANKSVLALVIRQDALHTENVRLMSQTQRLLSRNQTAESLLSASQGHTLIFRRDEELGRTVVSARQDPAALRRELSVFLDQIELTARQRGAGGSDNAPAISVPAPGASTSSDPAAREAALDALSENIADEGASMPSVVVVADARYNTFRGEAVKLDLRPYANALIFSKGFVIARSTVDGRDTEDVILKHLQTFLTNDVRTAALQHGIIPVPDPQSGVPLVGQPISSAVWVDLVKQIQSAGPDVPITATVAEDTYSADLLRLNFRVGGK